jgi:glutaredoxin
MVSVLAAVAALFVPTWFERIGLVLANAAQPDQLPANPSTSHGGKSTVPQIFIGDTHVGGCDDLYRLEGQGRLDELLA